MSQLLSGRLDRMCKKEKIIKTRKEICRSLLATGQGILLTGNMDLHVLF